MKEHPEKYQRMMETAHEMFSNGSKELKERNEKIRKTLSDDVHKKEMSDRIKNWQNNDPEGYKKARENNAKAMQKEETKDKIRKSNKAFRENNPELFKEYEERRIAACVAGADGG